MDFFEIPVGDPQENQNDLDKLPFKLFVWPCFVESTVFAVAKTLEQAIELVMIDRNIRTPIIHEQELELESTITDKYILSTYKPDVYDLDSPFGSWEKEW